MYFTHQRGWLSLSPSVNLVGNDGGLVDDDVHESEDVGPRLEVEEDGGVAVDDGALGQNVDGQGVGHGDDLGGHLDRNVNHTLQKNI